VNPTIPIPAQTTAVHGITDEKVANEPTFNELALKYNMIKDCDLGGFNSDVLTFLYWQNYSCWSRF
jgi:DNA polymerase-3 subunit epsilon